MLRKEVVLYLTCIMLPFSLASDKPTASAMDDPKLSKRGLDGLSFSYAATDIDSKSGTHIKTITVIKNVGHKKGASPHIDPELHKEEDWGTIIRNNFDKYGKIPDIPEIIGLHEFLKPDKNPEDKFQPKDVEVREEIPIYETSEAENESKMPEAGEVKTESVQEMQSEEKVEMKIPDDVEILETQPINQKAAELSAKAQLLRFASYVFNGRKSDIIHEDQSRKGNMHMKNDQYKTATSNTHKQFAYPETYNFVYAVTPNDNRKTVGTSTSTPNVPYIAPNKKLPNSAQAGFKQSVPIAITSSDAVTGTPKPYVAPKIQHAYQPQNSKNAAKLPKTQQTLQSANRGSNAQVGNNGPRFRGLRY